MTTLALALSLALALAAPAQQPTTLAPIALPPAVVGTPLGAGVVLSDLRPGSATYLQSWDWAARKFVPVAASGQRPALDVPRPAYDGTRPLVQGGATDVLAWVGTPSIDPTGLPDGTYLASVHPKSLAGAPDSTMLLAPTALYTLSIKAGALERPAESLPLVPLYVPASDLNRYLPR